MFYLEKRWTDLIKFGVGIMPLEPTPISNTSMADA
jgi:hypothetical protein